MCGENSLLLLSSTPAPGQPPYVWGERTPGCQPQRHSRTTPVCVGRTQDTGSSWRGHPDNPRMCGENYKDQGWKGWADGQPPYVWGERVKRIGSDRHSRTTPVCVGRTGNVRQHRWKRPDNPRMCGENPLYAYLDGNPAGQPPYVWGERAGERIGRQSPRTTPVCVGRTGVKSTTWMVRADNPRMCGENFVRVGLESSQHGQPPYVWGERDGPDSVRQHVRTTPVCVGRTYLMILPLLRFADNPRMCGENSPGNHTEGPMGGQPPYVWGELWSVRRIRLRIRTTPVCVGRTGVCCLICSDTSDNPRMCGENS